MSRIPLSRLLFAIESTLLKPEDTNHDSVHALCVEAVQRGFCAVCVRPEWANWAKSCLIDSPTKLVVVVGFPDGSVDTHVKIADVQTALAGGADEVDMVVNLNLFRAGDIDGMTKDIRGVVIAANGKPVKLILETHLLRDEEIETIATVACNAGVKFLKTCTGFTGGGATVEAVRFLAGVASRFNDEGRQVQVKASGGIRTTEQARAMLEAGATRLGVGTPSGRNIADGAIAPAEGTPPADSTTY